MPEVCCCCLVMAGCSRAKGCCKHDSHLQLDWGFGQQDLPTVDWPRPAAAAAASLAGLSHASPPPRSRPPAVTGVRRPHSCSAPSACHSTYPRHPTAARSASKWVVKTGQAQAVCSSHVSAASKQRNAAATRSQLPPSHCVCSPRGVIVVPSAVQLAWPEHKSVHKATSAAAAWLYCTKRGRGRSAAMPGFDWTGPLRPAPIGPPRQVRERPTDASWREGGRGDTPTTRAGQHAWVLQHSCCKLVAAAQQSFVK